MKINAPRMFFGFWLGAAVFSLINILLLALNRNQAQYDWYILAVAIVIMVMFMLSKKRAVHEPV